MALVEGTPQATEGSRQQRYAVAVKWLVDPEGPAFIPSVSERIDAARSAVLAFHAARLGLAPGAQLVDLNNDLRDQLGRRGGRRLGAFPPTAASAYLRQGHAGDVFVISDGQIESRSDFPLDASVDAVAWLNRVEWHFDVFSACKRVGGFASECRSGRVRRCVALAEGLLGRNGGFATVRVFNPQRGLVPVVNLTAKVPSASEAWLDAGEEVGR